MPIAHLFRSRVAATLVLALLLASPLAAQTAPSDEGPNIYPNMAARLVDLGVPVLDVRSAEEVEASGLAPNATRISHDDLEAIEAFLGDDTNRAVVLYCGSGRRASRVIDALRERGYGGFVNAGGYSDLMAALDAGPGGG